MTVLTNHASVRSQQRSFCASDISAVLGFGTLLRDGSVHLRSNDVDAAIAAMKQQVRQLERLRNTLVVVAEDRIVTVYKPTSKNRRKLRDQI